VKGAAEMVMEEQVHPEQLIDRNHTARLKWLLDLNEMEMHGFSSSLIRGIKTHWNKLRDNLVLLVSN
jgi:pyrroline-5-carboxylate reductase